jgi:DNA polymerase III alpha subunit
MLRRALVKSDQRKIAEIGEEFVRSALDLGEDELFSAHPLDLHAGIAWDSYCPISRLGNYPGQTVITCGLVITERLHGQSNGGEMKFITLCDYTGFIECEIFAEPYCRWGLATIRWPVVEVEATVTPFENGNGFTLDVQRVSKPRTGPRDIHPLAGGGSP